MENRANQWRVGLTLLAGCLLFSSLPACTEEAPPARSPTAASGVLRGSVYVRASDGPEAKKLAEILAARLAAVGFSVVTSGDTAPELVAGIDVALRETTGLLKVYVNGQPKKSYRGRATLRFLGGDKMLSTESIEYDVDDGPSEDQLRSLIALARGSGVQRYLAENRQQRREEADRAADEKEAAAEAKREEELKAKREQRRQEDAAWSRVVLSECSNPTQLDGCNHVRDYLASYPNGARAEAAKKALEAGTPVIAKLAEERDWRVARPEACATPRASTDCDGVTSYLEAQPAGAHVKEARDLLAKAEPRLAAARKAEEKRAHDEEAKADRDAERVAQEEKRREREQCKKETCLGGMCFNVRPGAFEVCMDRCVKANCE